METTKTLILTTILTAGIGMTTSTGVKAQTWPEVKPETKAGTRWWWLGSAVTESDIKYNLEQYSKAGIGSVEITPIYGVEGNEANDIKYLTPKWMEMLKVTEEAGKNNGILIDMNNGTGWPFGGPETPIEEAACRVVFVVDTVKKGEPSTKPLNPRDEKFSVQKLEKRYDIGDGREQVIRLYEGRTRQQVKRAAPGGEGYVIDHFDKTAVKHYLEKFDKAFAESGVAYPHNFFNDSYEVYHANWTPTLLKEFESRRGYKLEDKLRELLGMVDDGNQVLSDYRETLSDMLLENFSQQWTEWAHSHGVLTRNQAHGSPANLIDVYASVDVPEIEGFGLSEFGIKGLRTDKGYTRKNDSDVSMLKYAASAAHVTGKNLVSSETFTWLTEHFRTSLSQMKPDLDLMFTCGVNHVFFHGTAYSPKEDAWPGWKFYASVDMSPTNSIWRDAPELMKYIERSQSFLQMGKPDNDFLVYLPVRDMWRQRLKEGTEGLLMQFDIHSMAKKAPDFIQSIIKIDKLGYDCDYVSDRLLMSTKYEGGMLVTAGGTKYKALIIPSGKNMPKELKSHLEGLKAKGAKIIDGVDEGKMKAAAEPEKMKAELGLRIIRRSNETGHHYFIANLTPNDIKMERVKLSVGDKTAEWYDPMTGKIYAADINNEGLLVSLRSGESMILRTYNNGYTSKMTQLWQYTKEKSISVGGNKKSEVKTVEARFDISEQKWALDLKSEEKGYETNKHYELDKIRTWEGLDETARDFVGTGVYTAKVNIDELCGKMWKKGKWTIELGDVRESARVYINGKYAGCAWAVPFSLDITGMLKKGENEIRIEVTNLPANRIAKLDREGVKWRKMKEINVVDINYKKTTYAGWAPVESGLNSKVELIRK